MFIGLLRGFQDEAHDRIVDRRKMLLALPMGTGKGLLSVTNVLQPTGWVRAGDVQVGDLLIGRDGHPTKVTGVYPQPEQQLYEVTFVDGASVIVDGPHLWSVQTPDETHAYPDNWRTMSTLDLKDDLYSANGNRRWRIPMLSAPVQYHPVGELPVDPYLLGAALGDGSSSSAESWTLWTDREILEAIRARNIAPRPGCFSGQVSIPRELGLAGHRAWEKFIPEQYLRAAPEDRLALLQGLLDTDGSSDRRQHGVEFSSTSEALIDGVVDLVQGLGGIARNKTSRITKYTYNGEKREGRLSWRLNVKLPPHLSPFRLARKRDTYVPPTKYPPVRPIKSIEPATVGESVCFTVDAEDSLYVIKDHVVTHNTVTALAAVETLMEDGTITEPGIILAGSSIKYQWEQEIAKFTDSKAVVVSGTPTQREKTYEDFYNWRQTGIDYLIVTYDSMSNDRKIFRHLPKGFVIADECFPAGTLIDTPTGRVPIQFIQEGDAVLHATGVGRVRRTMSHMTGGLLRVQFTDGSSVVCTPEHKFFTAEGWQPARLLTHGASLVSRDQALRLVWEPDEDISDLPVDSAPCSQGSRSFLREVLLREVENVPARDSGEGSHTGGVEEEFSGTEGRAGRPLPRGAIGEISCGSGGMDSRLYGSSEDDMESQREHHQGQAREWYWTDAPGAGSVGSAGGAVVLELPRQDQATSWIGLPHQLQGGSRASGFETSRGSRWDVPPQQSQTATGPQEGRSAGVLRVDRIEVLQPRSPEFTRLSGGADRVTVYNLEVEGHPSYVANGALVHNCTALKGHRSKRSQRAKSLFATTPVKIGLSGTPIENGKPEQLYSIMEFIDPSVLGRFDLFDRSFIVRNSSGWVDGYKNLGTLHTKMKPAMVRRSFDDPEISAALPTEIVKEPFLVDLDSKTRSVMKRITKDLKEDLTALVNTPGSSSFDLMAHYGQGGTAKEFDPSDVLRGMVMSKITVSRMLCDHPQLVRDSADNYDRGDGLKGSAYASYLKAEGLLDITSTAKLDAVEEVVNEALADPKTKVVIFSTFVGMLDLIADRFTEKSVTYHGGMSAQGRQARKEQFQTDPQTRLFISSDAGGYGVDLPQANVLVNYDLPWQAGALDQRNARPRRVSSTWEYIVIEQAMVRDSLEEWQYQMLAHKTAVSQAILAGRGITATGDVSVPLDSLLSHLQK